MTDVELIKKAQAGDADAMEILLVKYKPLVAATSRRYYLGAGGDSDDLMQEGMIGLVKSIYEYREGKPFPAFASVCVANKIKDSLRGAASGKNAPLNAAVTLSEEDSDMKLAYAETAPDPLTVYINSESRVSFYAEAEKLLSKRQFAVLALFAGGYSYREIADKLGLSDKQVDNSLSAAKRKIAAAEDLRKQ